MRGVDKEFRSANWVKSLPEEAAKLDVGEWDEAAQGWWFAKPPPAPPMDPAALARIAVCPRCGAPLDDRQCRKCGFSFGCCG